MTTRVIQPSDTDSVLSVGPDETGKLSLCCSRQQSDVPRIPYGCVFATTFWAASATLPAASCT